MPSRTWTPAALWSERRPASGTCWRIVEAQHVVSTLKLVDTLEEQRRLEELLEKSKPAVPPECRDLHYLLSTPFRYEAPHRTGSRFRRAGLTPGVFYASRKPETAVAEMAFHRLLFYADAPGVPWPANAGEYTAFSVKFRTSAALDLEAPPLSADRALWTHCTDYRACQQLGEDARTAGIEVVKSASVRDPAGLNVSIFRCRVFASRAPLERQTWRMQIGAYGVRAVCSFPEARLEFDRLAFAADPRVAGLQWDR
jgi:hypothetical protein